MLFTLNTRRVYWIWWHYYTTNKNELSETLLVKISFICRSIFGLYFLFKKYIYYLIKVKLDNQLRSVNIIPVVTRRATVKGFLHSRNFLLVSPNLSTQFCSMSKTGRRVGNLANPSLFPVFNNLWIENIVSASICVREE